MSVRYTRKKAPFDQFGLVFITTLALLTHQHIVVITFLLLHNNKAQFFSLASVDTGALLATAVGVHLCVDKGHDPLQATRLLA